MLLSLFEACCVGAFVFGRTTTDKRVDGDARLIVRTRRCDGDHSEVSIPEHHHGLSTGDATGRSSASTPSASMRVAFQPPASRVVAVRIPVVAAQRRDGSTQSQRRWPYIHSLTVAKDTVAS